MTKEEFDKLVMNYGIKEFILLKLKKYLLTEYKYNCASRAKGKKPETILQDDLKEYLVGRYVKIDNPFTIDTYKEGIKHSLNEDQFQYDFGINVKGRLCCVVELKYDEIKEDGSSTNTDSEDQLKRDLYRLECWKKVHNENSCFAIFASNNKKHWEDLTAIRKGHYQITYEGKEEEFDLPKSYALKWMQSSMNKTYRFCIIEV